jgi:hypothetical protein
MNQKPETVIVSDIDQFIQLLSGWHESKVKTLEHMLSMPEGIEVTFNSETPQILSGDLHKGFIMGLSLALMELGTLPFAVEMEVEQSTAPADEPVH